jgi:hypothetical protein
MVVMTVTHQRLPAYIWESCTAVILLLYTRTGRGLLDKAAAAAATSGSTTTTSHPRIHIYIQRPVVIARRLGSDSKSL